MKTLSPEMIQGINRLPQLSEYVVTSYHFTLNATYGKYMVMIDPKKGIGYFRHSLLSGKGTLEIRFGRLVEFHWTPGHKLPRDVALGLRSVGIQVDDSIVD